MVARGTGGEKSSHYGGAVSEPTEMQSIDALLAAALQVNGRASWGSVARALDIPERTAARRGQRLLDTGAVRVSTYLDTTIVGDARPLVIELETTAGRAMEVAQVLAARPDASSVSVLEGSGEIVCMLLPRTPEDSARLLLNELPSIDGVRSTRVGTVLRYFRSGYDWVASELPDRAVAELRKEMIPAVPAKGPRQIVLSPEDEALVALVATDGRASVAALARDLNVSASTVRRRLETLLAHGALHVRTEISPALHGLRVEALTWLRVQPDMIETVGKALGRHPVVRFCVALTGTSQVMIDCLVRNEYALYEFLTNDVADLRVESIARMSVVLAAVRRGPMIMADMLRSRATDV
jgi:DNA-binding Lrp family transcriptional regulator